MSQVLETYLVVRHAAVVIRWTCCKYLVRSKNSVSFLGSWGPQKINTKLLLRQKTVLQIHHLNQTKLYEYRSLLQSMQQGILLKTGR